MRVSSMMLYDQLKRAIETNMSELTEKNLRLATGKKINKPSDDPSGAIRAIDYKVSISRNEQFGRGIEQADTFLDMTDKTVTSAQETVVALSNLLSSGSDTTGSAEADTYAEQAASYRDFLQSLSNTSLGSRYLFSGFKTDQQAFTFNTTTNHFDYNGDLGELAVPVDKGMTAQMNVQGSRLFSVVMSDPLPTSLSDGTPVSYTQATDPSTGVNTITIEIGNAGDSDYDTFSVSNVQDMANYLSFAWRSQDVDGAPLDPSASVSDLKAKHRLTALALPLKEAATQMLQVQSEIGARQGFIEDQQARLDQNSLGLENALSETEDADINETVVDIQSAEVALNALRSSSAQLISQSLFDFLQ